MQNRLGEEAAPSGSAFGRRNWGVPRDGSLRERFIGMILLRYLIGGQSNSFESLYTDIGRNYGHYYWSVDWYMTPTGPIAVTMENGQKDVFIIDLKSSRKVNAFHRALGISSLDVTQSPTGVVAQSGLDVQDFSH